jgi:gamma-glutamylcyclotransferase
MQDELIYFAYGSNLSHEQMAQRCPGSEPVGPARLIGYRLIFAGNSERWGGAVADVRPDKQWYVQGGIYRLREADLNALDKYEGHPVFYRRDVVDILGPSGDMLNAWIYRMVKKQKRGKPSRAYLETIIRGFFDFNIPPPPEVSAAEYIE